ncbi:helicase-related protein [Candidatus Dormiibacter inghamiae]|uniref:helicase-related protein n=1 Tax=Candidatus Dormiibacter inghamiae TaxID=3127013 RepID=UPI0030C69F42
MSLRVRLAAGQSLHVTVSCAYYDRFPVAVANSEREWWLRRPLTMTANIGADFLLTRGKRLFSIDAETASQDRVRPQLQAYSRPVPGYPDPDCRLVTVVLVNTTKGSGSAAALLQAGFEVRPQGGARIESYPELDAPGASDDEEDSIALLYRHKRTYAIGHGCAADWDEPIDDVTAAVRADPLPAYEVPSLTPDVFETLATGERRPVQVSMGALANGDPEGQQQLEMVFTLYADWVAQRRAEIDQLPERYRPAATRHVDLCDAALERMRAGRDMLANNESAARAFRLANEAMLYQQVRSRLELREVHLDRTGILQVAGTAPDAVPSPGVGNWRPFQIAFLLASLPDVFDPASPNRELVDLIFFPTGGGKTEAYLGAAAISMFARRLRNPADAGTDVLMRYTLRLLTAQQFLRAASLLCVMEDIRSNATDLGDERFSIGIWLGSTTTPNRWAAAKTALSKLRGDSRQENPFLLLRCPWCSAQMGPIAKGPRGQEAVGYVPVGTKVRFICPDRSCRFANREGLPIHVVDEDIYETRPSLVIGTVDKFAMLAWQTSARSLFGLDENGERQVSPPGLIIQDELHLISGPLGSMVGLYEPIIEDLCTDYRHHVPRRPKIIASTATIRRYEQQVRDLYGRSRACLFPPHGLEEGRSFFAEPARTADGSLARGRRYLGVMSSSLGSIQTVQVRVAASTLQAAMAISDDDRDGYWTNLNFLNSLRELGNTVSLLQSDIPDYLTGIRKRDGIAAADIRWPRVTLELTSRRRSDEIPKAIEQLQQDYGRDDCVDVCLASNIIEVGVDIDRLALMTIIGQPKTTAQHIQVSGRVGRRWWERPGLVITIYGAAKPRDRSHYERFRSYHQRLYAQVEPTSLTPFALPVLLRGLHGAAVAHIRQSGDMKLGPDPFPDKQFERAAKLIRDRATFADPAELPTVHSVIARRAKEWRHGERTEWSANTFGGGDPLQGLMRYAGSSQEPGAKLPTIWDTPTSMRSVDAECQLRITDAYAVDAASQPEESE